MRKSVFFLLACISLPAIAAADSITTADFFHSIEGNYTIVKAADTTPPADDSTGAVEVNTASTRFTFPYCIPNGACYLGITNFVHAKTQVSHTTDNGTDTYTIEVPTANGANRYQWEVTGRTILFRNFQFHLSATQTVELDMELQKAN